MNLEKEYQGTVLKIDDIPYPFDILSTFLTKQEIKVLVAWDGEEGIQIAEQAQPNVILLDFMMPGMNGFEVYQVLKLKEMTKNIPIIFMLSREDAKWKNFPQQVLELEYVIKPFQPEEVWERVKNHLKPL